MPRGVRSPRILWLAIASTAAIACTAINDTSQTQCDYDGACRARFAPRARCIDGFCAEGPPPLGCLDGEPPAPRAVAQQYVLEVWHASRAMPIAGVQLRMCAELDTECSAPLETAVTDEEGIARLTAAPETEGGDRFFVEATLDGYVPVIAYISGPWIEASGSAFVRIPIDMIRPAELSSFSEIGGLDYDPSLGMVVMTSTDCEGWSLSGVRLIAEPRGLATVPFLFHGLPVAVTSMSELTDGTGRGGFTNLSPGMVSVSALHVDSDRVVGERSVLVRPGWWTDVRLSPPAAEVYEPRVLRLRFER